MWKFTAFSAILMIEGAALVAACSSDCCSDEPNPCIDTGEQEITNKQDSTNPVRVPITPDNTYTWSTCSNGTIVLHSSCLATIIDCTYTTNAGNRCSCDFLYSSFDPTFGNTNRACKSGAFMTETGGKMYWLLKPEPGSPGGTITCKASCKINPSLGTENAAKGAMGSIVDAVKGFFGKSTS